MFNLVLLSRLIQASVLLWTLGPIVEEHAQPYMLSLLEFIKKAPFTLTEDALVNITVSIPALEYIEKDMAQEFKNYFSFISICTHYSNFLIFLLVFVVYYIAHSLIRPCELQNLA